MGKSAPQSRVQAANLAELYRLTAERFNTLPAFATRQRDLSWVPLSFEDLYQRGRAIGEGLIGLGLSAREPVGVFSDNRVEWILSDAGIQLAGAVNTPRGVDVTDSELIHIVNHSEMKIAFVENPKIARRCLDLKGQLPGLETIIQLDTGKEAPQGVGRLAAVEAAGYERLQAGSTEVDERAAGIRSDDLFSLIYTSGTTGKPKGVMLSHANIKQVEPTFLASAPRLWEKLHQRIVSGVRKAHPIRRTLFHIALFLGVHYRDALFVLRDQDLRLQRVNPVEVFLRKSWAALKWTLLLPWYGFFNVAVLESGRQKAGGSLRATISGGGALSAKIDHFFNAIGIPVLEGYGLTETSPVLAVRRLDRLVCGTVGPLIPETEIRIVELETGEVLYPNPQDSNGGRGLKGEIHVRGPQIMHGYYKDAEMTASVLDEAGWFRTGDLGMITFNDALKILGRSKSTIVLSNGENVEPEHIELRLKLIPFIAECVVVGQDAKQLGALILPDLTACREAGFEADSLADLIRLSGLRERFQSEIRSAQSKPSEFKRFEVIQDFRFIEEPFEVGVELTNLFKLKRHAIHERYASLIQEMEA